MKINPTFYRKTDQAVWTGRNDGTDPAVQRWHQRIVAIDLSQEELTKLRGDQKGIALIGFSCDEGVRRNGGRTGAKEGPINFRKTCGSLPVHFEQDTRFTDLGDIICAGNEMEQAQDELAMLVETALKNGYQPFVIGGGHEVAYGHYKGIHAFLKNSAKDDHMADQDHPNNRNLPDSIGIINFDAHFDLRERNENGYNSGTGFLQIANDCATANQEFRYLPIGIQQNSNTRQLFDSAEALNVNYISAEEFLPAAQSALTEKILNFIEESSVIYLTICMDVFSSSVAPGVSAAAYNGIFPDPFFFSCLQTIVASGKVISADIAEYNPAYDSEQRTAKLAAALAFKMINRA